MSSLERFLDPEAAAEAGAPQGQFAGRLASGGLAIACSKPVEEGARSQILIVPGLIRVDVWRDEENLSVIPRNLSPYEAHHTFDEATRKGYRNQDAEQQLSGLAPVELWAAFTAPEETIFFLALVTCVTDNELRAHHFMGKGEVWLARHQHRNVRLVEE